MTADLADHKPRILVVGEHGSRTAAVRASRAGRFFGRFDAFPRQQAADFVVVEPSVAVREVAVRDALSVGVSVICPMPIGADEDEARDIAQEAEARNLRLTCAAPWRYLPQIREAFDLIDDGAIGQVQGLRVEAPSDVGSLPMVCDLIREFLGEIVSIQDQPLFTLFRNHDRAVAELRRVDSTAAPAFDIIGSEGYLHIQIRKWRLAGRLNDGQRGRKRYPLARLRDGWSRTVHGCPAALIDELDAVFNDSRSSRGPATGWDGCRILGMMTAIGESARRDREVILRPLPVRTPSLRRREAVREANR